jgi:hypothetical protein
MSKETLDELKIKKISPQEIEVHCRCKRDLKISVDLDENQKENLHVECTEIVNKRPTLFESWSIFKEEVK